MQTRPSKTARASNGALRPVDIDSGAGIEPFDDVREPDAANHADHAHGLNGANVANGTNATNGTRAANGARPDSRRDAHDEAQHEPQNEPLSPDDPLAPLPFNPYKGNRGVTRAWHAMKNSLAGFRVAIREESAFRQELTLAAILIPCGVLVPVDPVSRVLLLGSVLLVLIVELLNSSVEAAIDRISLERHELSRRAKDLGSAAVMVALGMCLMTWLLIVGPLVVQWLEQ